ncbi:MAG: LptF/LptG family permease [Flavobacteriaceae bacterium]
MKILDKYILVSYLKTFISVFVILMFIFVLQTIWLYISELAGKDLDLEIILRFLLYFSPKLIPLVLPLTILVSSIMVFGSFAEKYEFAAMKSTGISLQRAMRSLMVFILLLSGIAFFFANNVIPWAEYKSLNLRRNIAQLKPAVAIAEGQFSEVGDITIKVAKKSGEKGQFLDDIIIHKKNPQRTGNYTVIKANKGELTSQEGSNTLSLILRDGNYYDEIFQKDPKKQQKKPHAKSYFDEYTINIDLSGFNDIDLEQEQELSNEKMYRMGDLKNEIDTMALNYSKEVQKFPEDIKMRSGITTINTNYKAETSDTKPVNSILEAYKNPDKKQILELAINNVNGAIQTIDAKKIDLYNKQKRINKYEIALHDKFVITFGCIVLFFVGAPLGAIIRKGGMGLPMVIAIALFLTYHFIGIFAKNSAENGKMIPFIGSWFSTFIMLPLGIWLTYRATTDQGIFDMDAITQPIGNFFKKLFKIKSSDL